MIFFVLREWSGIGKGRKKLISTAIKYKKRKLALIIKRIAFIIPASLVAFHVLLVLFTIGAGLVFKVINPPFTSLGIYRAIFFNYKTVPMEYAALKSIKSEVKRMFLVIEDSAFYEHNGISLDAMRMAYYKNRILGIPLFGGSTITQQLVRTLFLSPQKSYVRKYLEVIMSLVFDKVAGKDRVFELYLNNIEWGKGVYGIATASKYYYRKRLRILNIEECIRLAVIITSPIKYNVDNYSKNAGMAYRYSHLVSVFCSY